MAFTPTQRKDTYPYISLDKADFSGKSVLITGASRGIGKATAIAFGTAGCSKIAVGARSDLSATAAAVISAATAAGKPKPQVVMLQLDISSPESVKAATAKLSLEFDGKLDILCNNAAYLETWGMVMDSEPADWWQTWEVNVKGTYLCARHFLPLILRSDSKTIVNVTSSGANVVARGCSAYETSKVAVTRFTEFLVEEYGSQGLVAHAFDPGSVDTDMARKLHEDMYTFLKMDAVDLPADTTVWLVRERREWLTGRFVSCSWDMEELEERKEEIVEKELLKFRIAIKAKM
ncbi:NAD-P-binding protein [Pseudomassariella vexata]|uniref:NAD-P-binding protein n=1 Tax=Pseudomassariella vexata TaxID=1141098 RepID=A0A1Y2DJY6_9PEZI|nr:NAD-P-binding protein [Pseudomassariella vexata]ORY59509.1 NAD-P-binding protein [Pseudomassariella vexata]